MKNITTFNLDLLNKFNKIYCLVSGGIDSTYLYELLKNKFNDIVIPVNCFNPFETNLTLKTIKKNDEKYISISPNKKFNYHEILKDAFMQLPKSFQMKKYSKKVFGCCYYIKHKAFMNNSLFKEENTVVISGIKYSDGRQRQLWLKSLFDGVTTSKGTIILNAPTFFHKHKGGQLYCYPFRDFKEKEFPIDILNELKQKYSKIDHSGCYICPVLVRFEKRIRKMEALKIFFV